MIRKPRTLSPDDCAAVDLLLDNAAARPGLSGSLPSQVVKLAAGVPQPRLTAARKLLAQLDRLPPAEPPADLVARTMAAIDADVVLPAPTGGRTGVAATFH